MYCRKHRDAIQDASDDGNVSTAKLLEVDIYIYLYLFFKLYGAVLNESQHSKGVLEVYAERKGES